MKIARKITVNGVDGHIDCVIDGELVDIKSALLTYGLKKFKDGSVAKGQDPFGYIPARFLCQRLRKPKVRGTSFASGY